MPANSVRTIRVTVTSSGSVPPPLQKAAGANIHKLILACEERDDVMYANLARTMFESLPYGRRTREFENGENGRWFAM